MDVLKALQLTTLRCVMMDDDDDDQDREFQVRQVFRWYSRRFHTPLHQVADLPFIDVMTAYLEETFEEMDADDLEARRVRLLESDEARKARVRKEEEDAQAASADNDEWFEAAKKEELERIAKLPPGQRPTLTLNAPVPGQLIIETMGGGQARVLSEQEVEGLAALPLVETMSSEPLINMNFDAIQSDLEELDGFGSMPHPDRNKRR